MVDHSSADTKSHEVKDSDLNEEISADEDPTSACQEPAKKAGTNNDSDDDDYNDDAAVAAQSPDDEDDQAPDAAALVSEANELGDMAGSTQRRAKSVKRSTPKTARNSSYLDIEPMSMDTHLPRGYAGHFDRNVRGPGLVRAWYGPDNGPIEIALRLLDKWADHSLLPPRELLESTEPRGIWQPDIYDRESTFAETWQRKLRENGPTTKLLPLSEGDTRPYVMGQGRGALPILLGPESDYELSLEPGQAHAISQTGLPLEVEQFRSGVKNHLGWIFDVGGIVLCMDWARQKELELNQILALAVIPHSDQEDSGPESGAWRRETKQYGTVQLWRFRGEKTLHNTIRPSLHSPTHIKTLCINRGRVRRVRWGPACNHLAVLTADGSVLIFDAQKDWAGGYEMVQEPIADLQLLGENSISATAMAWVNFNRMAVGYSDGSVALWSIYPCIPVSRHIVHHSPVVDMASGYPTKPYLLCSSPIGGVTKIIDLQAPSYETSEVPTLSINMTGNLMSWSDHLLGFFSLSPSSNVLNTMVSFMYHRNFPIVRRIFTGERMITAMAVGRTHPYLLIGTSDGTLWALNPQFELIHARRELTDRIRILHHEHRPLPGSARGVSRILQGYRMEKNKHSKSEARSLAAKKKKKNRGKEEVVAVIDDDDETGGPSDPTRGILSEPLARITDAEWNPNQGFGTWAAVSMGSGCVRIIDLAVDRSE